MRIGEVAQRTGLSAKTLRYYETIGLVQPPVRTANGYREYDHRVLDRLAFIRGAQASGLTLAEIRTIVAIRDRGDPPCDHVRDLIARRTAEIDERIAALDRLRGDLTRLAEQTRDLDASDCDATVVCQIIAPERPRSR